MTHIIELIKEETEGNVIIEKDINTMKCRNETKIGSVSYNVENPIAPLQGFWKILYRRENTNLEKLSISWISILLKFTVMLYFVLLW